MAKQIKKRSRKAGLPPGSPVYIGDKPEVPPSISVIRYNKETLQEISLASVSECKGELRDDMVTWINIAGVSDVKAIELIGKDFELHHLVVEDIVNTAQRPKVEDYERYLYIVLKLICAGGGAFEVTVEQISVVLGSNFVISFEEGDADFFRMVKERLRTKGQMRAAGADYLAYVLVDIVVDHLFLVLEIFTEKIEQIEEEVIASPTEKTLKDIYASRRAMFSLKRSAWPLRELSTGLMRDNLPLIQRETKVHIRDVYDHTVEIIDIVETLQQMNSGMLDVYLSSSSNRMNSVMQVLTVITTIFMPLTFIVGVYGMNFEHMPELEWKWGYPAVLVVMFSVALAMISFFQRKKWI